MLPAKIIAVLLIILPFYGCTTATKETADSVNNLSLVRLQATNIALKSAAIRALNNEGFRISQNNQAGIPLLILSENINEKVSSVRSDGSAARYEVSYQLIYRLDDQPARTLSRNAIVNHSDHSYRASDQQRQNRVSSIRLSLLHEAIQTLLLEQPWAQNQH